MSYVTHANADLTPKARGKLARLVIEQGWTLRRAAERFQCSPATVKKWVAMRVKMRRAASVVPK